jgi:hypothetical protein
MCTTIRPGGSLDFDYEAQSAALKPRYLMVWSNILTVFLGWSNEELEKWSRKWDDGLNNATAEFRGWFYHETAEHYVIPLLIPETLRRRLSAVERNVLVGRLQWAITQGDSRVEFAESYDWRAAKSRVEAVLIEYGETLPVRIRDDPT